MGNAYYRIAKTGLITISYNIGKDRVVCSIGQAVPIELWNPQKNRLNKRLSAFPIDEVNAFLNDLENFVNAEAIKLKIAGKLKKSVLYEIIKNKINPNNETKLDFIPYCEKYLKDIEAGKRLTQAGSRFEKGTIKGIKSKIEIFKDFDKNLTFEKFDSNFYNRFVNYLTNKKKMKPNSIGTVIKVLKTILKVAETEGYNFEPIYKTYKVTKGIGELGIALNESELNKIRKLELTGHLDNARNIFLLGCETGLRFGDYSILDEKATKGRDLHVIQAKTKAKVIIPINNEISRLLGLELRKISNQKLNDYLKEIGKLVFKDETVLVSYIKAGDHKTEQIQKWKLLSSHVARRTFATLAFKRGVPSLNIMAITGHKSEKSFLTYIKVSAQEHADMFRSFGEK